MLVQSNLFSQTITSKIEDVTTVAGLPQLLKGGMYFGRGETVWIDTFGTKDDGNSLIFINILIDGKPILTQEDVHVQFYSYERAVLSFYRNDKYERTIETPGLWTTSDHGVTWGKVLNEQYFVQSVCPMDESTILIFGEKRVGNITSNFWGQIKQGVWHEVEFPNLPAFKNIEFRDAEYIPNQGLVLLVSFKNLTDSNVHWGIISGDSNIGDLSSLDFSKLKLLYDESIHNYNNFRLNINFNDLNHGIIYGIHPDSSFLKITTDGGNSWITPQGFEETYMTSAMGWLNLNELILFDETSLENVSNPIFIINIDSMKIRQPTRLEVDNWFSLENQKNGYKSKSLLNVISLLSRFGMLPPYDSPAPATATNKKKAKEKNIKKYSVKPNTLGSGKKQNKAKPDIPQKGPIHIGELPNP